MVGRILFIEVGLFNSEANAANAKHWFSRNAVYRLLICSES